MRGGIKGEKMDYELFEQNRIKIQELEMETELLRQKALKVEIERLEQHKTLERQSFELHQLREDKYNADNLNELREQHTRQVEHWRNLEQIKRETERRKEDGIRSRFRFNKKLNLSKLRIDWT